MPDARKNISTVQYTWQLCFCSKIWIFVKFYREKFSRSKICSSVSIPVPCKQLYKSITQWLSNINVLLVLASNAHIFWKYVGQIPHLKQGHNESDLSVKFIDNSNSFPLLWSLNRKTWDMQWSLTFFLFN